MKKYTKKIKHYQVYKHKLNKHKLNKHKLKRYKNPNTKKNNKGGEAVAAGGYGCVFKPALSCVNPEKIKHVKGKEKEKISKLLMKENAYEEMEEIDRVLKYIKKNPYNSNYFIINEQVSVCTPAKLSPTDLNKYDEMCSKTKMGLLGINKDNINYNLEKLNIITMLDGGDDLEKVWSTLMLAVTIKLEDKFAIFKEINEKLIALLNKAIVPLNKDGLYHFDIKSANILLGKDGYTRLIDWGTSFEGHRNNENTSLIPQRVFNRAMIQYNVPFSNILFMEDLNSFIQEHVMTSSMMLDKKDQITFIKSLSKKILLYSLKEAGSGHFDFILENLTIVYKTVFEYKNFDKENARQIIEDYIGKVLMHYFDFKTMTFKFGDFFHKVFMHNLDIYGFLIAYIDLVIPTASFKKNIQFIEENKNNKKYNAFITEIASILDEFCWSTKYAVTALPLSTITSRLHKLNYI